MIRVSIDTNIYTAFKRNHKGIVDALAECDEIILNPVVLAELYSGFLLGKKEEWNKRELDLFLGSPRVSVMPISEQTTLFYAHIFSGLRRKGTPIPTNDIWIAACAMENGTELLSLDSHFKSIDGLLLRLFGAE